MDNAGPMFPVLITERDSRNNIVSQTETLPNGEFLFYLTSPDNRLRVTHDGYNDIITNIEGTRLVFLPQTKM